MLKSQAIKNFLVRNSPPDLAELYHKGMECQVNVAKDEGERIEAGDYKGRAYVEWTNGLERWKSFRIPAKAMSEPEDNDGSVTFDFDKRVEGIGLTGWDWQNKKSIYVTYDFDAMIGHSEKHTKKLSDKELLDLQNVVTQLPFITLRKSTSGKGLHLYIFINKPVDTQNHTEHAALARAILSMIAGKTSFNFTDKVDICGGNMWVWHRKMKGTDGLKIIKKGEPLPDDLIPPNWKDHLDVVSRRSSRIPNYKLSDTPAQEQDLFDQLTSQRSKIKLDEEHIKLINFLSDNKLMHWWNADAHMLVTHTAYLRDAHQKLNFKGKFFTLSDGRDYGNDINCFCFSGNTEFITKNGVMTLEEASKLNKVEVLSYVGNNTWDWVEAEIKYFGNQETVPLVFGNNTSVYTTKNHRWLWVNGKKGISKSKKTTTQLKISKTELPLAQRKLGDYSEEGYAHGFVYGDGNKYEVTKGSNKFRTQVLLFKNDIGLINLLRKFGKVGTRVWKENNLPRVYDLPEHWKELPNNPTPGYALGFILGLISADGFVNGPSSQINQSGSYETICEIRNIAIHAGLQCFGINEAQKYEGSFSSNIPAWVLKISNYNIPINYFLREDHKNNYSQTQTKATTPSFIGNSGKIEPVFCAVVPKYHNFVLSNGVTTSNCFPCINGSWAVRRYGINTAEHKYWKQDSKGYTRCYYNRELTLEEAARIYDAIELENKGYQFHNCVTGMEAMRELGVTFDLPQWIHHRCMKVKETPDYKYVLYIPKEDQDNAQEMQGWSISRGSYTKVCSSTKRNIEDESSVLGDFDDLIRHCVSEQGEDLGWKINSGSGWREEPIQHIKLLLKAKGYSAKNCDLILGQAVAKAWVCVNKPFQPEYPGDRQWNVSKARFRIPPTLEGEDLSCPTWDRILSHCGKSLDSTIQTNDWCKENGVRTGADYLKLWLACLIRYPQAPLPYLGLFGPQNSGKSTLHEAFCQLILDGGYARADTALTSGSGFNGELEGAVLAIIEETNVAGTGKDKLSYNRLKDWATSAQISIHKKGSTPYMVPNFTHWIQCANERPFIPVFSGDTRVTLLYVDSIPKEHLIPKRDLWILLQKEAPDFLATLLLMDIPDSRDRLMLPVINTIEKEEAEYSNMSQVERFFKDFVHNIDGAYVSIQEVFNKFVAELDPAEALGWNRNKFGREVPKTIVKGRISSTKTQDQYFANISLDPNVKPSQKWISTGNYLKQID